MFPTGRAFGLQATQKKGHIMGLGSGRALEQRRLVWVGGVG